MYVYNKCHYIHVYTKYGDFIYRSRNQNLAVHHVSFGDFGNRSSDICMANRDIVYPDSFNKFSSNTFSEYH